MRSRWGLVTCPADEGGAYNLIEAVREDTDFSCLKGLSFIAPSLVWPLPPTLKECGVKFVSEFETSPASAPRRRENRMRRYALLSSDLLLLRSAGQER